MAELKKCPFCGKDKLKIDCKSVLDGWIAGNWRVERHTYSVRCSCCHARGTAVGGKVCDYLPEPRPNYLTTDKELMNKAIETWNKRATEADIRAKAISIMGMAMKEAYPTHKANYVEFDVFFRDVMLRVAEQLKEK